MFEKCQIDVQKSFGLVTEKVWRSSYVAMQPRQPCLLSVRGLESHIPRLDLYVWLM